MNFDSFFPQLLGTRLKMQQRQRRPRVEWNSFVSFRFCTGTETETGAENRKRDFLTSADRNRAWAKIFAWKKVAKKLKILKLAARIFVDCDVWWSLAAGSARVSRWSKNLRCVRDVAGRNFFGISRRKNRNNFRVKISKNLRDKKFEGKNLQVSLHSDKFL